MFDNGDTDSLLALDTTRSFGAPGTIGTLGTIEEGFTPGGGGHAYTAGSGLASFQPLLTGGGVPSYSFQVSSKEREFSLSTHDTVSVDYMNIPGMAPVNYASVGAKAEENKKRRQPPRPSAMSKGDDYYYNEPGSSQSKRYKAEFSENPGYDNEPNYPEWRLGSAFALCVHKRRLLSSSSTCYRQTMRQHLSYFEERSPPGM